MNFLDAIFGSKTKAAPDGTRLVPCILCAKIIQVRPGSATNKFFYPLSGKHYACCARGCDGKGQLDNSKLWSRIAAIPESQRSKSDISDLC